MALKDMLPSKPRRTVMGVSVGKSSTDWGRVANAAVGVGSGVLAAVQAGKRISGGVEKGKEVVQKGEDAVNKVSGVVGKVSSAAGGASKASSPIGKALNVARAITPGGAGDGKDDGQSGGEGHEKQLKYYIEEHIDVGAPRGIAYDQWTQFEEFSSIFKGVQGVDQEDDKTTKWQAKIGPSRRQWTAEITEQLRPRRIAWRSTGGVEVRGVVTFHEIDDELTRVMVQMLYHPRGFVEVVGNWFRAARRRTRKDLKLFKNFIEVRREPTGAWRGEIRSDAGRGDEAMEPAEATSDTSRKPSKDERMDRDQDQGEQNEDRSGDRRSSGERSSGGASNGRSAAGRPQGRSSANGARRSSSGSASNRSGGRARSSGSRSRRSG